MYIYIYIIHGCTHILVCTSCHKVIMVLYRVYQEGMLRYDNAYICFASPELLKFHHSV